MKKNDINLSFMKTIFKKSLDIGSFKLDLNSSFEEVPGWDSLGHMKIISELEETLGVDFEIEEIVGVDTVSKLIDMAKVKIN